MDEDYSLEPLSPVPFSELHHSVKGGPFVRVPTKAVRETPKPSVDYSTIDTNVITIVSLSIVLAGNLVSVHQKVGLDSHVATSY